MLTMRGTAADLLNRIAELENHRGNLIAVGSIGFNYQELAFITEELYSARQNLQWMEKIVADMYMAADAYGL